MTTIPGLAHPCGVCGRFFDDPEECSRKLAVEHACRISHVPQVSRLSDGRWGVFCARCSHDAADYVYPCRERPDADYWPPATLTEPAP